MSFIALLVKREEVGRGEKEDIMTRSLCETATVSLLSSAAHPPLNVQGQAFPSLGGGF